MPATLTTARLRLTPVGDHDLAPLHAHWNDPRAARHLWDANPVPTATVAEVIARSYHTFQTDGWGLWALRRPQTRSPSASAASARPTTAPGSSSSTASPPPTGPRAWPPSWPPGST